MPLVSNTNIDSPNCKSQKLLRGKNIIEEKNIHNKLYLTIYEKYTLKSIDLGNFLPSSSLAAIDKHAKANNFSLQRWPL